MAFKWRPPDACVSIHVIRDDPGSFPWYPAEAGFCGAYADGDYYYDRTTGGFTVLGWAQTQVTTEAGILLDTVDISWRLADLPGLFFTRVTVEEFAINQGIPATLDKVTQTRQLYGL